MAVDWVKIKTEYITTGIGYRKLAEKYEVSFRTLSEKGNEEGWVAERKKHREKVVKKAVQKAENRKAKKLSRIDKAADKLLTKLEKAIDELELTIQTKKVKVKVIEYNNDERPDKPTREVVTEDETVEAVACMVDRAGLRMITAALRDLKEVKMVRSELDKQEQEARIANLRRQAEKEDNSGGEIEVVFAAGPEEWNE